MQGVIEDFRHGEGRHHLALFIAHFNTGSIDRGAAGDILLDQVAGSGDGFLEPLLEIGNSRPSSSGITPC